MTSMTMKTTIPDFEVQAFFDEMFPEGWKQTEIARILDVHRTTVATWLSEGMPVPKARELVAWRVNEIIRANAKMAAIMDRYGL